MRGVLLHLSDTRFDTGEHDVVYVIAAAETGPIVAGSSHGGRWRDVDDDDGEQIAAAAAAAAAAAGR